MYDHIPFTNDAKRFNPIKLKALKAEFGIEIKGKDLIHNFSV